MQACFSASSNNSISCSDDGSFIPLQPIKQSYSLPYPITKYIFTNASTFINSKLFRSCKELNQNIPSHEVDVLEIGICGYKKPIKLFYSKEKQIRLQINKNNFRQIENLKIKDRVLFLKCVSGCTISFLEKINYSMVKEVFLITSGIFIDDYKKLMLPSIETIYAAGNSSQDNFDLLNYTLSALPNLKVVRLPWTRHFTTFEKLAQLKRFHRLQKAEIFALPPEADAENLIQFVSTQMESNSVLNLAFKPGVNFTIQNKFLKITEEINFNSNTKVFVHG